MSDKLMACWCRGGSGTGTRCEYFNLCNYRTGSILAQPVFSADYQILRWRGPKAFSHFGLASTWECSRKTQQVSSDGKTWADVRGLARGMVPSHVLHFNFMGSSQPCVKVVFTKYVFLVIQMELTARFNV